MRSADPREGASLRLKLVWLTVFRTVATTLLLGVAAARLLAQAPEELGLADTASFALISAVYLLNIFYGLWLRRRSVGSSAAYVQVFGDVLLATALVYLTGAAESPFTFAYSIAIIAGAILLDRRGALVTAFVSMTLFGALVLVVAADWVRPPTGASALPPIRVAFAITSNAVAQVLIAILAGYLSTQLSVAGRKLFAREQDLDQLARLQRQILADIPSGLITCTPDGKLTYVNRAAGVLLGLESRSHTGHVHDLLPGVLQLPIPSRRAELYVERSDRALVLGVTVTPLEAEQAGILLVFQDLTELRRAEQLLRRNDRLAELGALSAQLAHEIRNPLAAMRSSAQMLAEGAVAGDTTPKVARILLRETDRLTGLVEEFLRFARPPPPVRKLVRLDDVVAETMRLVAVDPSAGQVRLELRTEPVEVAVDPDQFRQVVLNLVRNGLSAAADQGRVRVTVDHDGAFARLKVWDSAGAIPAANLQRIFDPFFTTKEGGTGLGLSTAHAIINAHGGAIEVTSHPASGTEFTVSLPL